MVAEAVKERFRAQYRTLDPVILLAEIRAEQEELGSRIDRRAAGRASRGCRWNERCGNAQLDRRACRIRPQARQ
jgi:hypothetical protein